MTTFPPNRQITNSGPGVVANHRRHRLRAPTQADQQARHCRPWPDAWQIVEFAEAWSPFGGPPDEELFVRFGMNRSRFAEVLAESVDRITHQLRPRQRRPPAAR
ncbi:hypothetical protein [Nocardia brevicatena]|uniref:hypothetical protein n=1 Tax=Nocardia brevicatena TaxID=37327 RepID=UPI000593024F|nr:hypothetical protein [Nocardia brevicatena]